jgi:hypothetical protein
LPAHWLESNAYKNGDCSSLDFSVVNERPPTLIANGSVIDVAVPEERERIAEKGCEAAGHFDSKEGRLASLCLEKLLSSTNELHEIK